MWESVKSTSIRRLRTYGRDRKRIYLYWNITLSPTLPYLRKKFFFLIKNIYSWFLNFWTLHACVSEFIKYFYEKNEKSNFQPKIIFKIIWKKMSDADLSKDEVRIHTSQEISSLETNIFKFDSKIIPSVFHVLLKKKKKCNSLYLV